MLKLILIRHSITEGNLKGRYIGTTDEPLCSQGLQLLKGRKPPAVGQIYMSPMRRCVQTAEYLYPEVNKTVFEDFRECDFGDFENKNYRELDNNPDYQAWIDSQGTLPFPNGESQGQLQARCCYAFEQALEDAFTRNLESAAFVVHGGTIMSIMERFALPQKPFYDWQIKNAQGLFAEADREEWELERTIRFQGRWPE